ncbi:MAG TPA: DUF3140 domain-containing protein [Actinotalea sp.]|nr:DUF3140 domain-containing protein [Actinotalea sp.]
MLWLAFHRAVTVQPPDLRRWLDRQERTARATGRVDQLALGRQVADLLETQRCDLTSADIRTMRAVLTRIRALRAVALTCAPEHAEDVRWHLLALGHDLKRAER